MATGDVKYRCEESRELTAAQAGQFATLAKNLSGWSGAIGNMRELTVRRDGDKFRLIVSGIKVAPLAGVPRQDDGSVVIEGIE